MVECFVICCSLRKKIDEERRLRLMQEQEEANCKREREAMRKEEILSRKAAAFAAAQAAEEARRLKLQAWMNGRSTGAGNVERDKMVSKEVMWLADRHKVCYSDVLESVLDIAWFGLQVNHQITELELRTHVLGSHHSELATWLLTDRMRRFKHFDADSDGTLSMTELTRAVSTYHRWKACQPEVLLFLRFNTRLIYIWLAAEG